MDYSKLSDFEINKRVFNILMKGRCWDRQGNGSFNYCNNAADAWMIITSNRIGIIPAPENGIWRAANRVIGANSDPRYFTQDANPLRAAMIVFLKMQESANVQDNSTGPDIC